MVRLEVKFSRTWGLWQLEASDRNSARIYMETPDEAKARAGLEALKAQNAASLDDIEPLWSGMGPWDGVED